MTLAIIAVMYGSGCGGGYFAYASATDRSAKRVNAIAKPQATGRGIKAPVDAALKRKNVQALLKEIESKQADEKKKLTMRQRLEQAGFANCDAAHVLDRVGLPRRMAALFCLISGQT